MSKKEKIKKWLKENYKSLIGKIILVLFALLVVFSQIKNCYNHLEGDTTLSSQPTKRLHLDDNDNLVSDNLLNIADKETTTINGITYTINKGVIVLNGTCSSFTTINLCEPLILNGDYVFNFFNDFTTSKANIRFTNDLYWTFYPINRSITISLSNIQTDVITLNIASGTTFTNSIFKPMLVEGILAPSTFEPYGLTYYSQNYINQHYVSNETNAQDKETAFNNGYDKGLNTNLKSALIDLLDTNDIDGVYAYDSQNNIDYSANYMTLDNGVRVENLPGKKGLVFQYKRTYNVNTLRFSIPTTAFISNDNWEYIYFKVYLYNSSLQSFTSLDVFTNDTTSASIYINGVYNGNISFDKIYIGYDILSSINYTFESISLHSQVAHIYTDYFDTIFQLGYNEAVASGESFNNGYSEGFKDGEKAGIYQGQLMQTNFTLGDIMKSVISAPVEVLGTTLDFDIPGTNINIFSVVRLVITCLVIAFTIKFLRG